MGAAKSEIGTGPKSSRSETDSCINIQDVENNNSQPNIVVNPHDFLPVHTLMDECDLLNNNTTLINNNYMTVSLSPSSTTLTTTFNKLNQKQAIFQQQIESQKEKTMKESPKKKVDAKARKEKEKEKKKKKEKPKAAPRGPSGGGAGKGGRGMENKEQMTRRPRKKTNQEEK